MHGGGLTWIGAGFAANLSVKQPIRQTNGLGIFRQIEESYEHDQSRSIIANKKLGFALTMAYNDAPPPLCTP